MKLSEAHPAYLTDLKDKFTSAASDAGFSPNWQALIVWAEKYVPDLFIPAVLDVISGNWAALLALAASKGPEALAELLAALGISLAPA